MTNEALVEELVGLYELTSRLRKECPWDRRQTQESIIPFTVEEVYELADTIAERKQNGDEAVQGELGDLLYQVFLLSYLAEEEGLYDLGEVAAGIRAKLVRRHPHVFGEESAETADDVRTTWDAIKRTSEGREGIFHEVPGSFPSLLLAQKLQQRAAAVGFDWHRAEDVMAKVEEETAEVHQEMSGDGSRDRLSDEVGDLLFAVVNLARKLKVDPELALRGSAHRFRERVEAASGLARQEGLEFEGLSLEDQEEYYQRAKEEQGR